MDLIYRIEYKVNDLYKDQVFSDERWVPYKHTYRFSNIEEALEFCHRQKENLLSVTGDDITFRVVDNTTGQVVAAISKEEEI